MFDAMKVRANIFQNLVLIVFYKRCLCFSTSCHYESLMNPYMFTLQADTQDGTWCACIQLVLWTVVKKKVHVWFLGLLYKGRKGLLTCLILRTVSPNFQCVFPFHAHPTGKWVKLLLTSHNFPRSFYPICVILMRRLSIVSSLLCSDTTVNQVLTRGTSPSLLSHIFVLKDKQPDFWSLIASNFLLQTSPSANFSFWFYLCVCFFSLLNVVFHGNCFISSTKNWAALP